MNRTIAMTFGDRVYDVPMAPIKRAKAWRAQLRAPIDSLMGVLSTDLTVELSAITDVVTLVNKVLPALLDAPETLLTLLYAYAPLLEDDKEFIESEGYDDQIVAGFLAVIKAAFPLDRLTGLLGPATPATLKS